MIFKDILHMLGKKEGGVNKEKREREKKCFSAHNCGPLKMLFVIVVGFFLFFCGKPLGAT